MSSHSPTAVRNERRALLATITVLLVAFGLSVAIGVGSVTLTPSSWIAGLQRDSDASNREIIAAHARTTRAAMAVLAGFGLGVSGALLQALYRNPLAGPSITGVSQGAITAVIVWVTFGPAATAENGTVVMALVAIVGGSASGLATYGISRLGGSVDPMRLILIGVLLGGVLASATSFALLRAGERAPAIIRWISGALNSTSWDEVWIVAGGLALLAPFTLWCIPLGNALALGDESAHAIGQSVPMARLAMLLTACALTAVSIARVGGLAFVGLVAPHLARPRVGSDLRRLVPAAGLAGAGLVLIADGLARNLRPSTLPLPFDTANNTLPAGLFLAVFGGLFFVRTIRRTA